MSNRNYALKTLTLVSIFIAGFYISGIESAFCDDTNPMVSDSHDCQVCQSRHHSTISLECATALPIITPVNYTTVYRTFFKPQDPIRYLLRPPIFL